MSSEPAEDAPVTEAAPPGATTPGANSPGSMIREARNRARMSVEELAAATKLARHTLEALERDDFNSLQEAVYVRGYYRKCAKILGLNETELVSAYQGRVVVRRPDPPAKLRLASGTEIGEANRLPVPMAVVSAVAAVVIGILLWNLVKAPESALPPTPVGSEQPLNVELPLTAPPLAGPDATSPQASPEAGAAAPTATATSPSPAITQSTAAQAAPPAQAAPAPAPAPTSPAPAAAATDTLSLRFSSQSWARIEDASGRTLLNGLIREGESPVLRGQAPFSVFLGNGPGVQIEYDGQAVDFARHIRDNLTASFRVPAGTP
jgi:cytoskeleton protein RodZ